MFASSYVDLCVRCVALTRTSIATVIKRNPEYQFMASYPTSVALLLFITLPYCLMLTKSIHLLGTFRLSHLIYIGNQCSI